MRAALKRWRWAHEQRDLEASLFCMGGFGAWQRVKALNDVTGVWRHQRARNRAHAAAWCVAVAALFLVPLLASCGGSGGGSQAGCRAALVKQWQRAVQPSPSVGTEPGACKGLSATTVQRLWVQAGTKALG